MSNWDHFVEWYFEFPELRLALDVSRIRFSNGFFDRLEPMLRSAQSEMEALEAGAIANKDEHRMVGHYWLRTPERAPNAQITDAIEETQKRIVEFVRRVQDGQIRGRQGAFTNLLVIGIGGSALGPQFVADALGDPVSDRIVPYFLDNTDPDGFDRVFARLNPELGRTLCLVISKSGGTKETRNGMLEAKAVYGRLGLEFGAHAVAVTGAGSELDTVAESERWLARFPMWDWVGGRTSELSAVGLLPAALQGIDIDALLDGARICDEVTRRAGWRENPAAQLALAWYHAGNGRGAKDMVVLPYKDRLELFSKYLQQLIMESLGKELDRNGHVVNQGIAVYGNKGSTDQHAYVQQLREGLHNFFVTFIQVLKDREGESIEVEPGVSSGDYLHGFLLGTRDALFEKDRESLTLTVERLDAFQIGVLIALYERAVGLYAALVNVNAYHQPGVEAGKKAAGAVILLRRRVIEFLRKNNAEALSADQIADRLGDSGAGEVIFQICRHAEVNGLLVGEGVGVARRFRAQ